MYKYKYPHPAVTADCVVFARCESDVKILLIQRGNPPYQGCWAFPGGFMEIDENAECAAIRELQEETGLVLNDLHQIGAFTEVNRDPRERVITIAYYTIIDGTREVTGQDDAAQAQWFSIHQLPPLAFDHAEILEKALKLASADL